MSLQISCGPVGHTWLHAASCAAVGSLVQSHDHQQHSKKYSQLVATGQVPLGVGSLSRWMLAIRHGLNRINPWTMPGTRWWRAWLHKKHQDSYSANYSVSKHHAFRQVTTWRPAVCLDHRALSDGSLWHVFELMWFKHVQAVPPLLHKKPWTCSFRRERNDDTLCISSGYFLKCEGTDGLVRQS